MRPTATMLCAALAATAGFASAQDQAGAPSAEFQRRAARWLESTEASKRQAACRSFLQLGPEAMPSYCRTLESAARYHRSRIDQVVGDRSLNPYAPHAEAARELDDERERVLPLIRTDWKKDPAKIRMLREEVDALGRLHERTMRLAAADNGRFDAELDGTVAALVEIARELERFEPDRESAGKTDEELRRFILDDHLEGQLVLRQRERFEASRREAGELAAAGRDNAAAGPWADSAMREFAGLLNRERGFLGLPPLRLEEKLSAAAAGHSGDMARLGFFSHTSPIPEKQSPAQRARLAGFTGGWSGENIFAGSASFTAAYNGWFASDGHRFIMFASGPDVIGVGISGQHWTMMTGRR